MGDRDRGGGRGERAAREGSRAASPLRRALGRRVLERLLKEGGRRGGLGWVSTWLAGFFEKISARESLGRGARKSEFRASSHLAAALNDRVSARADVVAHNANAHHRLIADATPGWEVPFKKVKTKQGGRLIVRSRRRSRRVARGKREESRSSTFFARRCANLEGANNWRERKTGVACPRMDGDRGDAGYLVFSAGIDTSAGKSVIDWFTRSPSCSPVNWQCSTKIDFGIIFFWAWQRVARFRIYMGKFTQGWPVPPRAPKKKFLTQP